MIPHFSPGAAWILGGLVALACQCVPGRRGGGGAATPRIVAAWPTGLAGALGEAGMRDLLAFLTTPRGRARDRVGSPPDDRAAAASGTAGHDGAGTRGSAPAPALPRLATEVAFPNLKFERPVAMAYPDDGSNLLFVVEQRGRIWSFPDEPSTADKVEFLDIRPKVLSPASGGHNEEGLLGLAFHPDYRRNGEFFVYYSAQEGPTGRRSIVSRFTVSRDDPRRADPASEQRIWIGPPDPYGNHNGGSIAFGPDGYLYITLGDGGAADDPLTTGQNPSDWFGSILRIDVDHPGDGKPYGIPKDNPRLRDPRAVRRLGARGLLHRPAERLEVQLRPRRPASSGPATSARTCGRWSTSSRTAATTAGASTRASTRSARGSKDPASTISPPLVEYPHSPEPGGLRPPGRRQEHHRRLRLPRQGASRAGRRLRLRRLRHRPDLGPPRAGRQGRRQRRADRPRPRVRA